MRRIGGILGALALCAVGPLGGQELNPRAFWPAPAGTNVFSFGYSYAAGGVVVDPSLPIEDGESQSHGLRVGYVRYVGLAGRTTSLAIEIPRSDAKLTGLVGATREERLLAGAGDVSLRFAMNIKGAPRMTPQQFREFLAKPESLLGLSLRVTAPTGLYDTDRLINLGTNRWSFRPEIGYIASVGGWVPEVTAGVRFFTDNDDFVGAVREQEPIASIQVNLGRLVRRTRPDFWYSLGISYANGGRTTIDGIERDDLIQNAVVGGTLVYPLGKTQALRLTVVTEIRTSIGQDSTAGVLGYSKAWR
jgi:hypothetical protein